MPCYNTKNTSNLLVRLSPYLLYLNFHSSVTMFKEVQRRHGPTLILQFSVYLLIIYPDPVTYISSASDENFWFVFTHLSTLIWYKLLTTILNLIIHSGIFILIAEIWPHSRRGDHLQRKRFQRFWFRDIC